MTLATGGSALGATSTKSSSTASAASSASFRGTTPTCLPSGPTRRTSFARISLFVCRRSFMFLLDSGAAGIGCCRTWMPVAWVPGLGARTYPRGPHANSPPIEDRWAAGVRRAAAAPLPGLAVRPVRAAARAELLHLQALALRVAVLRGDVVALLALRASQRHLRPRVTLRHRLFQPCSRSAYQASPGRPCRQRLLDDLGDPAGAHGAAALADGEAQALLHRDRLDQVHHHLGVVTRHHHLGATRQLHRPGHIRGPEVELRPIVVEEPVSYTHLR